MSIDFKYKPDGQTIKHFMKSDDFFRGIRGPVGSGKSVSCCIEIFRRDKRPKALHKACGTWILHKANGTWILHRPMGHSGPFGP